MYRSAHAGPIVGAELRKSALIAVILRIVSALICIALRFEFVVGLGAINVELFMGFVL